MIISRTVDELASLPATTPKTIGSRLSRCGFAVRKNFRNRRRKVINTRTGHNDAVTAAVSFLCDTQEPAALIFPELDIKVLALNLQFFRLDDVVHFALRAPSLGNGTLKWKKNPRLFKGISYLATSGPNHVLDTSSAFRPMHGGLLCCPLNLDSRASLILGPLTMPHSIDPGSYRSPDPQRSAVPLPIETDAKTHDPYAAFRFGDFALFTAGNLLSITGRLMLAIAVEWEIYARTHSATALGLVGLAIALPVVTLSLPAGHLADRISRKHIILVSQVFSAFISLALALVSWKHLSIPQIGLLREGNRALAAVAAMFERHNPIFHFDDASVPLIYLLIFIGASARTFSWAARSSFFPTLVPRDAFANAVTWNNSIFQI